MSRGPDRSPAPREMLAPGSAEWCRQTVFHARTLWAAKTADERRWMAALAELRAHRAWRPLGFPSLDELLRAEIGVDPAASVEALPHGLDAAQRVYQRLAPDERRAFGAWLDAEEGS